MAQLPAIVVKKKIDSFITDASSPSVLAASAFLLAYSLNRKDYDFRTVPVGIRGKYGDKKFSEELNRRFVTIHDRIVAFAENVGWKGNVAKFDLETDDRFTILKNFKSLSTKQRNAALEYMIWYFFDSIRKPKAMPALDDSYLTYGRCIELFDRIIRKKSGGHFPQFLICAILFVHRKGLTKIVTHHPHAADKYDGTFGDIEEFYNDKIVAAYEVTVRSDWRNRIEGFKDKMIKSGLRKYILIAGDVSSDSSTNTAKSLLKFTNKVGFDLAVIDIYEFVRVFVGDMTSGQLIEVINKTYEYLLDENLCGKVNLIDEYQDLIDGFMVK